MAKVKIQGHASGTGILTVTAPNTSTDRTITLPDEDVTLGAATPSIDDNGDATAITIDSSERVGIGTTSPDSNSKLHVYNGASGQSAATNNTEVVIENNSTTGISFLTPNNASSGLWFADPESNASGRFYYTHSDNSLNVFTGGTQRLKIDGDGLKFNTDTAAANALDDYEEGLHTTSAGSGSGSITLNSTNNKFYYTKIGRQVTITGRIDVDSVSSPTGDLYFTLPFASASAGGSQNSSSAGGLFVWNPTSGDAGLWVAWLDSGGSNVYCRYASGNQASPAANLVQTATEFRIGLSYMTD